MRIRPLFVLRLCCSYFLRIFAVYFSKYIAMRLIADSGSTKTDWCVVDDGMEICRVTGQGINPFQQDEETIRDIIHNDVVRRLKDVYLIDEICFYGAGCRDRMICVLEKLLSNAFDKADRIEVCSDMLGAARALFGVKALHVFSEPGLTHVCMTENGLQPMCRRLGIFLVMREVGQYLVGYS